ncbi:hypothetical protein Droror1_Dr00014629 [Drosera rotundifolia]
MLTENGEIHVTHKTAYPFNLWKIGELAKEVRLYLVKEVAFHREDYPGYVNKRGSGNRIDNTFPLGECSTFKFAQPRHPEWHLVWPNIKARLEQDKTVLEM